MKKNIEAAVKCNYIENQDIFISEDEASLAKEDPIGLLMKQALEGVVVVPWALMLDKWRSGVFNSGTELCYPFIKNCLKLENQKVCL